MNIEETNTVANSDGSTTTYHGDGSMTSTGSMMPGIVSDSTPHFPPGLQLIEEETDEGGTKMSGRSGYVTATERSKTR